MDPTTICNLALAHLGQEQIMSLDDESPAARFCQRFYPQTRDEVMAAHRWNFAMAEAFPAELAGDASAFGWSRRYALPLDCLRALEVNGLDVENPECFEVAEGILLTNESTPRLRYLARVEDATLYPPLFVDALVMKLAARLAKPLTGNDGNDFLTRYAKVTGPLARRADAVEGRPRQQPAWMKSSLVGSRAGFSPDDLPVRRPVPPAPPEPPLPPPPEYYVYLAGGIEINPEGVGFYLISLPPTLKHVVTAPPFTVTYLDEVPFAGASYSSIEILVYEGPIATGTKVAYGNASATGSLAGATISLPALGCFDSNPDGAWNFNCVDL